MTYVPANHAGRAQGSLSDTRYFDSGSQQIVPRNPKAELRTKGERTLTFAKPPSWTESAKCTKDAEFGKKKDKRYDLDYMSEEKAQELCAGCPIIEACLSAAMETEGDLTARNRYGIWGGTTPKMRAAMAVSGRACEQGHRDRWSDRGICLECMAERKREQYRIQRQNPEFLARRAAALREARSIQRVSCLECRSELRAAHFSRHLEEVHGVTERSVA